MTAGRFDAPGQGESDGRAETWEPTGTWDGAETWDYDEARANPEAYDRLESRLMRDREQGPRFARFHAAMAEVPTTTSGIELPRCTLRPADPDWLHAIKAQRLWASALWLIGAAGAGVVAGLVSTNLVALALNAGDSDLFAEQAAARSALSAPAPSSITSLARTTARQAPGSGGSDSTPSQAASSDLAGRTDPIAPIAAFLPAEPAAQIQVAALAEPLPSMPEAALNLDPSAPPAAQLTALVRAAPGLPELARATPVERAAAPTPTPPPAAAEARVTTALAPVAASAPSAEYRVQLALLRDQRNAKYVWHDFVVQFGPAAKKLHRYVVPTQTARGTRHLLQVGPFEDEGHAEAMCSKLKQRGGDCLVVREPS